MAYIARIEHSDADLVALPAIAMRRARNFSALEWSVIRLARIDPLWTALPAGRIRRLWNWLTGRPNPELANPRLEALRKMAVLSWHKGFAVTVEVIADFLSAGFSRAQYELLVSSVSKALRGQLPEVAV
jgi:hypothetical protein